MQGSGEIMCLTATLILLMGRMIGGDHLISDHNNVFSSLSHVNFVSTLFLIHLLGVHGLSQADVDLVIAKAERVVEGSKAAMVRLTFNDCVGK